MSNSKLVNYTRLSPNYSSRYGQSVTRITPHHMAGNLTVETCGAVFASGAREASANYGIATDGRVGLYVDEKNRSWASSNGDNDRRAVTIEVANDQIGGQWHVSDTAYNKLIDLCVDICQRYGKKKLLYLGSLSKTNAYTPKSDEMLLTMHQWFAATACPGPYLKSKFPDLAEKVTARLGGAKEDPTPAPSKTKLEVDGVFGYLSTVAMQNWLGTYADGIISDQLSYLREYYEAITTCEFGYGGSLMVETFQKLLNKQGYKLDTDGYLGQDTVTAWQKWLNTKGHKLDTDGYFGPLSAKAMQEYLNSITK